MLDVFVCSFGPDGAQRCITFNSIPIILYLLTNRNIALIYSVTICEQKTKDSALSGSFQHKLQHRCFSFDVCRLSLPPSSTKYHSIIEIIDNQRTDLKFCFPDMTNLNTTIPLQIVTFFAPNHLTKCWTSLCNLLTMVTINELDRITISPP